MFYRMKESELVNTCMSARVCDGFKLLAASLFFACLFVGLLTNLSFFINFD